jgi:sulfur carrier protein ThiS
MRITVRLHTILRRETPEGIVDRVELDLPEGASVAEAVAQLAIERRPRTMLLVVNGKIVAEDRLLAEGDELRLVPGVSGGSCQLSAISRCQLSVIRYQERPLQATTDGRRPTADGRASFRPLATDH